MNNTDLLKRIAFLKTHPKLAESIPQAEIFKLLNEVLSAFALLQKAIEENKLKGDQGEPGVTPRAGVDFPTFDQVDAVLTKSITQYEKDFEALAAMVTAKLEAVVDGKDAEITDELIAQIALEASKLLVLPDFDQLAVTALTRNNEATRDGLELFTKEEDKLKIEAIGYLREELDELADRIEKKAKASFGGGIGKAAVIDLINQYGGSGSAHTIEDEGTPLTQRDTLNFVGAGVTVTDAGGKTVVTIPGGGGGGAVDSVNGETGAVVLTTDDISDAGQTNKWATAAEKTAISTALQPADIGVNVQAYDADLTAWAGKTAPAGVVVGTTDTQTLENKTVTDSTFTIQDEIDNTKKAQFQLSAISTGTTRTYTLPNGNATLVGNSSTVTLTNKTIALGNNTITGTKAEFNAAVTDGDIMYVGDAPTAHTHPSTDITDFTEAAQDAVAAALTDTTTIDAVYDDVTNAISFQREALTGDVTASKNSNATTIANDAVTNAKAANMAQDTIKGRVSTGTGDPEDLSATQVRTLLAVETTTQLNARDTANRDRANHTGTQAASTISDFNSASRAQTEAALIAGTNITITPAGSGATRTLTIAAPGGGGGGITEAQARAIARRYAIALG